MQESIKEIIKTHYKIDNNLCGEPIELNENRVRIKLKTTDQMEVDDHGLVHGGFIFSLADYAAMLAVNKENVVLAEANVKFLQPVKAGDEIIAEATIDREENKKIFVEVQVWKGVDEVFYGELMCIVPEKHVLSD